MVGKFELKVWVFISRKIYATTFDFERSYKWNTLLKWNHANVKPTNSQIVGDGQSPPYISKTLIKII